MTKILVIHGPNLDMLGERETDLYGNSTLADIDGMLRQQATAFNLQLATMQSNAEHEIINAISQAKRDAVDFILFNPAAFTHTSIAIRDALLAVTIPFIEIHLSNPHAREAFRKTSYFSDIALGTISGFHAHSYTLALDAAHRYLIGGPRGYTQN